MVYEVRCDNCGDLLEFGGSDPEENVVAPESKIPEDALEFNGNVYCEDCVKDFVKAGIGDVEARVDFLEEQMDDVKEELGMEKHQEI